jgi:GNAT superfamily N-acetyltransferase
LCGYRRPVKQPQAAPATPDARERVIETVVSAFAADPAFHYFFADEAKFTDQAATFAGYLFDQRVNHGTVWVIEEGAAVAMWDPPRTEDDASAIVHETAALELPDDTRKRLDRYDAAVEAALPSTPYWYLGVLATHPGYAGRGWGRIAMAAGLDRAAVTGLPAYLETTNKGNVALYERAGWHVTESTQVDGLPIWVMRHG